MSVISLTGLWPLKTGMGRAVRAVVVLLYIWLLESLTATPLNLITILEDESIP